MVRTSQRTTTCNTEDSRSSSRIPTSLRSLEPTVSVHPHCVLLLLLLFSFSVFRVSRCVGFRSFFFGKREGESEELAKLISDDPTNSWKRCRRRVEPLCSQVDFRPIIHLPDLSLVQVDPEPSISFFRQNVHQQSVSTPEVDECLFPVASPSVAKCVYGG